MGPHGLVFDSCGGAGDVRQGGSHLADTMMHHSVADFKGTWRRFEIKGKTKEGALVIDDYAHHPTAIRETLKAAREKYPGKKLVVAFHPHLYSRTRDLMDE